MMKLNMIAFFAAAILIHSVQSANYGSDFYIGSMRNYLGDTQFYKFHLATLSETNISYSVEDYLGIIVVNGTVSKSTPTVVTIPTNYVTLNNTERNDGLHLTATGPVSVLVENYQSHTIGEYAAYPKQEYSGLHQYEYYTVAPTTGLVPEAFSQILLVGTADNTIVTVTPTVAVTVPSDVQDIFSQQIVLNAGNTKHFTLNKLQTFFFRANVFTDDLTGTAIVSDMPLTVIAGHECANIPAGKSACEHVEEQIPPTVAWGSRYLIRAFTGKEDFTYYKIVTSDNATVITHNCGGNTTSQALSLGVSTTIMIYNNEKCYLEANKPILISQMMAGGPLGDPAISILPPIEQYTNEVIFHTPSLGQIFQSNYINIVTEHNDTIMLDNSSVTSWETISYKGSIVGYSKAINVSVQTHHVYSTNGLPFHVMVYGYRSSAGYTFSAGVGKLQRLRGGQLTISPWYGHTFGGVPIAVSGPVFKEDDVIICLFDDIEVDGVFLNEETAICPSPQLIKDPGNRAVFQLKINNALYEYATVYYPLSLEDTGDVEIATGSSDTLLYENNEVSLSWDPDSLRKSVADLIRDDEEIVVDVRVFEIDPSTYQLNEIGALASELPNTGSAMVTLDSLDLDSTSPSHMITVFIQPTMPASPTSKRFIKFIASALRKIGKWARIAYLLVKDHLRELLCFAWLETESPSIGEKILKKVREEFPCPPTFNRAQGPNSGLKLSNRYIKKYHPKASNCFRQIPGTESRTNGYGNQCCYGDDNNLIVGPNSGGTVDKVAPSRSVIGHYLKDVYPYEMCCPEHCDEYYKRRPSDDGTAWMDPPRPPPPIIVGDPHIVTLDLYKYTFNGKGEFILIETNDNSFTVQGRMVEAMSSSNTLVPATVFSAIVARQFDSDPVQIELYNGDLIVLMNGVELDFTVLKVQRFPNVTISFEGNDTVSVSFTEGEFIKVVNTNGFLSTMIVSLPKSFMGKTSGLMGSYNGDMTDDLIPKGSTTPLPLNSTIKEIHESFGVTWIIDDPADSLFTYLIGLEWSTFYFPAFTPNYSPVFSDPELEANASAICGDDLFCLFDIAATGRVDIGMTTLQGGIDFNILVELSKPVICDPPCGNGACVKNNTCSCSEGYTGKLCDTIVYTECVDNRCHNNGTCKAHVSRIVCTCPPQYTGQYCEEVISECIENPCMNGGTCRFNESGSYICECGSRYSGEICESSPSPSSVGAIVGGTIAGVVCVILIVALVVLLFVCIVMRRNKNIAA